MEEKHQHHLDKPNKTNQQDPQTLGCIVVDPTNGCSVSEGRNTRAVGYSSHAEGTNNNSYGIYSHTEGEFTSTGGISRDGTAGEAAHAEGSSTEANGFTSHAEGYATKAMGVASHTEGAVTNVYGDYSHAEGYQTIAGGGYGAHSEGNGTRAMETSSHAEGYLSRALGPNSHAEGHDTEARVDDSHAEGYQTIAGGGYGAHSEGNGTQAMGTSSHAEGYQSVAFGPNSHAEGKASNANNEASHAEGQSEATGAFSHAEGGSTATGSTAHSEGTDTTASGIGSHAEGYQTVASGDFSHAEGFFSDTNYQFASHIMGRWGIATAPYSWFLANGSPAERTPVISLLGTGNGCFTGKVTAMSFEIGGCGAADFAEMFETVDGEPIEVGYFVTLDKNKIRIAKEDDDYILGITSANPAFITDSGGMTWKNKFLKDEWGRIQYHNVTTPPIKDKEGNIIFPEDTQIKPMLNPEYDPTRDYVPRCNRPEWIPVGIIGKLRIRDDGSCQVNGYCKPNDEGIATASNVGYRILERTGPNQILVLFK
ncbi:TPA: hypothetical protein QC072_005132 [Bacillus cereus]|nr:hypothetical protein [Bacillus cereus]